MIDIEYTVCDRIEMIQHGIITRFKGLRMDIKELRKNLEEHITKNVEGSEEAAGDIAYAVLEAYYEVTDKTRGDVTISDIVNNYSSPIPLSVGIAQWAGIPVKGNDVYEDSTSQAAKYLASLGDMVITD